MAFTDDFTGSDGQKLQARSGWSYTGDGGTGYDTEIRSNACRHDNGGGSTAGYYICTDQGSGDQYIEVTIAPNHAALQNGIVAVRLVDSDNFIGLRIANNNDNSADMQLIKRVGGSITVLESSGGPSTTGDVYRIECSGSSITLKRNGAPTAGSPYTVADVSTSETSAGLVCLGSQPSTQQQWDSFENGALGAAAGGLLPAMLAHNHFNGGMAL